MELAQLTTATPLLVLAVAILVSLLKPVLEATVLPPSSALHDTGIRIAALLTGCLVALVASIATVPPSAVVTAALVLTALIEGGKAALISVATYHLLTSDLFSGTASLVASSTPLEPATLLQAAPPVQRLEIVHSVAPMPSTRPPIAEAPAPAIALPPGTAAAPSALAGGSSVVPAPATNGTAAPEVTATISPV